MPVAVMDDDDPLQCSSSSNVGDVGDFNDLITDNLSYRCDIMGCIIEDVCKSQNLVTGMQKGQKWRSSKHHDMYFSNDDEDPIMEVNNDENML